MSDKPPSDKAPEDDRANLSVLLKAFQDESPDDFVEKSLEVYRAAIERASVELQGLILVRRKIDGRIRNLNQTLGTLFRLTVGDNPDLPMNFGLTDAIREVLRRMGTPVTAAIVTDTLRTIGFNFTGYKNPQGSVNGTLMRLSKSGEVKKLWITRNDERMRAYTLAKKPEAKKEE